MLVRTADYYHEFRCLAGACPHSCCEKWEVVLDEESVARYSGVEGALGEKLRAAMTVDEDGDTCFALHGGRCPFLDEENLCEIHRCMGEEATSITCREHPRFTEDYGAFCEITLSASCPEANRLLLGSDAPLTFLETVTEAPEEEGDPWLSRLLPMRMSMIATLQNRDLPLRRRLAEFLALAQEEQKKLDEELEEPLAEAEGIAEETAPFFPGVLRVLASLEILEEDWISLLQAAEATKGVPVPEALLERVAVYASFRYLLKTVNDGDLLSRAKLVVLMTLVAERLAAVCGLSEALRRFSCEIEHSEENLEQLLYACGVRFSLQMFFAELT